MFFDDLSQIPAIAAKTGFSIFATDPDTALPFKHPYVITPTDRNDQGHKSTKSTIRAYQIRDLINLLGTKQATNQYIIFRHADNMHPTAANAFLKNLEEPRDNYHFIFLTKSPSMLLPTILSRGQVYYPRPQGNPLDTPPATTDEIRRLAKQLIAATSADLPTIADFYHKKKPDVRRKLSLEVVGTAIEILYKSYFTTKQSKFLIKLPQFVTLYDNLSAGGHIKLHIVADLC